MKLYKLTNASDRTFNNCQWGPNVTVITSGKGGLCGPGFTHWYDDPLLAVILNPIHGGFCLKTAHLWEGEGTPVKFDRGLKFGCAKATTLKRIEMPEITLKQKMAFGLLCVLKTTKNKQWRKWAKNWLNGTDRSASSASKMYNTVAKLGWPADLEHYDAQNVAIRHITYAVHLLSCLQYETKSDLANAIYLTANYAANYMKPSSFNLKSLLKKAMKYK